MHEMKIRITDQLHTDLARGAKAMRMTVSQFAAYRLSLDRYAIVTESLISEGHLSTGRGQKNETVL
jgi:hypothetical protein